MASSTDPHRPASSGATPDAAWGDPERGPARGGDDPTLVVDVGGYEGPLDLLLTLARTQKVDLSRISVLQLADQYLAFIDEVRRMRLELAADYLVMAAWLAYLKSRLLLPEPPKDDQPSGEDLAEMLAFRLRKLAAMREKAATLMNRHRLGRDVFARGAPEPITLSVDRQWQGNVTDLFTAYAAIRQRTMVSRVHVARRTVWSLADARAILERLIGPLPDWVPIEQMLEPYMTPESRASVRASAFSALLEMVREGKLELRQTESFAPLFVRTPDPATRQDAGDPPQETG